MSDIQTVIVRVQSNQVAHVAQTLNRVTVGNVSTAAGEGGSSGPGADVSNATVNAAIGTNAPATRTALGLGSAALADAGDFVVPADLDGFDLIGAAAAAQTAAATDATTKANAAQNAAILAAAADATSKANAAQATAISTAAADATTKANAAQGNAVTTASVDATSKASAAQTAAVAAAATDATSKANAAQTAAISAAATDATTKANAAASASTPVAHGTATNNPHSVTKAQVGLGNVDNTADADKPMSAAVVAALALVSAHPWVAASVTIPNNAFEFEAVIAAVGLTALDVVELMLAPTTDADENVAEMLDLGTMAATSAADKFTVAISFSQPTSGPIGLLYRK